MSIPVYSIVQFPSPLLALPCQPVTQFGKPLERIVKRMISTMNQADGVGLAANQAGLPLCLAVMEYTPARRQSPSAIEAVPLHAIINPTILSYGSQTDEFNEGCLSCPNIELLIQRSVSIIVEFSTIDGIMTRKEVSGFAARIYQHEIDHLNGRLILDQAKSQKALVEAYRANPQRFQENRRVL